MGLHSDEGHNLLNISIHNGLFGSIKKTRISLQSSSLDEEPFASEN
jgi:hypothetical protein